MYKISKEICKWVLKVGAIYSIIGEWTAIAVVSGAHLTVQAGLLYKRGKEWQKVRIRNR